MYLDQPGLMELWDRIKAVFAPKSHTHQASDVSGVVADVRIHGTSITADGVADIPIGGNVAGVVKSGTGTVVGSDGAMYTMPATHANISSRKANDSYGTSENERCVISPSRLDYAVKAAMCDGKGAAWTAAEQAAAKKRMGITEGGTGGGTAGSRIWFSRQEPGEDIETYGYFGFKLAALVCSEALAPIDNVQVGDTILWNGYAYFVEDTDGNEAMGGTRFEFAPHNA